ncbi:MAG: PocR ligand-binding domain-containing protein [Spirochaetota bacterium]
MGKRHVDILINEGEIRELLYIILRLFGLRAGYFCQTADGSWKAVMNKSDFYCEYCMIARRRFAERCERSNNDFLIKAKEQMSPLWYQCYNGLHEMYLPLTIDGHDAGFLHLGQVRTDKDFDAVARECGLNEHPDIDALRASYQAMPVMERSKLEMIAKLVTVFAENIVRNRLVDLTNADPAYFLERYIDMYACSGASIRGAARFIGKSTSYVTHMFRTLHRMPFRDYLTRVRIDRAREYLLSNSIEEAALRAGFKNRYHFTRVFTKTTGSSPAAYQKRERSRETDKKKPPAVR